MATDKIDMAQALSHPQDVFGTPQSVLTHPQLASEQKYAILTSWEQDARELAVAEEEGMAGGEQNMLQRVVAALDLLRQDDDDGGEHAAATTKHGGSHT